MIPDDNPLPFWFDDGPAVGATPEALARAESATGFVLPASLSALLFERDGGVSNYLAYASANRYVSLPSFFSVQMIVDAFRAAAHFGTPPGVLAIASTGHSWLGLDYRQGTEPLIVYQESDELPLATVAPSFDAFLAGLVEEQ